jgi:DNA-binding IclR family transcriptional regulator
MRRTLDLVHQCGRAVPSDLAAAMEEPPATVSESLAGLLERRLVMHDGGSYVSLQSNL